MIVLSLFDGMSCGQIALRDMGIIPEVYYASEIDKFAIAQTQLNFPETIQLGSVTELDATKLGHIDLLIGGSPCQSFSFAGKRVGMATTDKEEIYTLDRYLELKRGGFQFEGQSYLFWEYMRILNEVRQTNPDVLFLLENVEMGKKWEKVLSDAIGIQGVHINSALVSAQTRKRIYWTNIRTRMQDMFGSLVSDIPLPKDRNIFLQDILLDEVDEKYYVSDAVLERMRRSNYSKPAINSEKTGTLNTKNNSGQMSLDSGTTFISTPVVRDRGVLREIEKSNCIVANYWKGMDNHGMRTMIHEERFCVRMQGRNPDNPSDRSKGCTTVQRLEAKTDGKTNCLTSVAKDNLIYSCITQKRNEYGKSIRKEYEKGNIKAKRSEIQDIELREDGKTNTLTTVQKDNLIYEGGNIPMHIPEATKKGYAEIFPGECFDATQLGSKTRRGRKMTGKCNCLMAQAIPEYYLYEKSERIKGYSLTKRGIRPHQGDEKKSGVSEFGTILFTDQKTNSLTTNHQPYFITDEKSRIEKNLKSENEKGNCLLASIYKGAQANGMTLVKRPVQLNPSTESNGNQPYQQNRVYSEKGLSPVVMANMSSGSYAVQTNERIRRLTPTECARLQTIPEWYKWECSETQQYKMLGNGWTVEVIKHIFSFLPIK